MILIKPSVSIEHPYPFDILAGNGMLLDIERYGRTCYKSEDRTTPDSARKFVEQILKSGHESVIEHCSISVRIICDRGVTHEIVRHRLASYSQESTRYCNYKGGVTFIIPPWVDIQPGEYNKVLDLWSIGKADFIWVASMLGAEEEYKMLLSNGWSPQQARSVLPNSLKTEIIMTCNLREWRHFLKLRTSPAAHPQMREVALMILDKFKANIPIIFKDIKED